MEILFTYIETVRFDTNQKNICFFLTINLVGNTILQQLLILTFRPKFFWFLHLSKQIWSRCYWFRWWFFSFLMVMMINRLWSILNSIIMWAYVALITHPAQTLILEVYSIKQGLGNCKPQNISWIIYLPDTGTVHGSITSPTDKTNCSLIVNQPQGTRRKTSTKNEF